VQDLTKKNKVWLVTFFWRPEAGDVLIQQIRLAHVHAQSDQFDLLLILKPEMRNLSASASQIMLAYQFLWICGRQEECDRRQRAMPCHAMPTEAFLHAPCLSNGKRQA
jgi:hypothetical protein